MLGKNQILKIYGTEYEAMTKELLSAAGLAALIGDREKRICIKPNLVCPVPAELGATTHTEVVAGILSYLQENGFHRIVIAEGSWVGDRTSEAFDVCGYRELAAQFDVPLIDTQKSKGHEADADGMKIQITDVVDQTDFLINVPVLKGHCQTKMTCALKNLKGLLPNAEKSRFHRLGLHKPIAYMQKVIRQDFIVVDHISGDLDFEEGGNPVVKNCVMAARDPVLTDSYACRILGYSPDDVPYVRLAEKLGVGSADIDAAEIQTIGRRPAPGGDEIFSEERHQRMLDVSYAVEEVDSCSACYSMLIAALSRLSDEGLLTKLHERIGIGQGMRGRKGTLGIGKCTKDFDYCIMGCPPDEDKIYHELRKYITARSG